MKYAIRHLQLRDLLERTLIPLINGDYFLVDLPFHSNIGDTLIWQGELELLRETKYRCLSYSSLLTFRSIPLGKDITILLHGGGNMGELYREHISFLFRLVKEYPDNRIIVFPQTICYRNMDLLRRDMELLRKHRDLHFCVRDKNGYALIKNELPHVYLLPDMCACIDLKFFQQWKPKIKGSLLLKRKDAELSSVPPGVKTDFVEDWPTFNHDLFDGTFLAKVISNLCKMCPYLFRNAWNWYAMNVYRKDLLRIGTKFIKSYEPTFTTRLHGLLLSLLCGKHQVTVIDNSYGKNLNYVRTWLYDVDEIRIMDEINTEEVDSRDFV